MTLPRHKAVVGAVARFGSGDYGRSRVRGGRQAAFGNGDDAVDEEGWYADAFEDFLFDGVEMAAFVEGGGVVGYLGVDFGLWGCGAAG